MARKTTTQGNLNVTNSAELLSYIINQTPELRENIDLPVQGQSIKPIGKLIMGNPVYKNAFLNTVNLIGLTVITRNNWENPWQEFTDKGTLSYGQQVREIIVDIANVYDYNQGLDHEADFIKTVVPNVLSYVHELNYQKYYKTTTSDEQMAMAFEREDLFTLIDQIVNSLYEGYQYDMYLVAKYVLARRILEGTVTAIQIPNYDSLSDRDLVAFIKGVSNKMTFRSPNYNPAGIRKATKFDDQFAIVTAEFDGRFTTNVLATSYFRDDAQMKANLEMTEGFGVFDTPRLNEIFAVRDTNGDIVANEYLDGYVPLTDAEMTALNEIPVSIVGRDFFQFYKWAFDNSGEGLRKTDFFNPQTLKMTHWLHTWSVVSSSPFENAVCFTKDAQGVTSVTVSPSTATVSKGQNLELTATVVTTGFANKAVYWSVDSTAYADGVRISDGGKLIIPSTATVQSVTVTATSIYDNTVTGTATITVA